MECYYHSGREIVAVCSECGKGLCKECASKWEPILCDDCAKNRIDEKRAGLKQAIGLGVLILAAGIVIGLISAISEGNPEYLFMGITFGYAFAGLPNGWRVLSNIQPSMFLILPVFGWVIYFLIKALLAMLVGLFVFPMNIYRYWKGNKEADALEEHIK